MTEQSSPSPPPLNPSTPPPPPKRSSISEEKRKRPKQTLLNATVTSHWTQMHFSIDERVTCGGSEKSITLHGNNSNFGLATDQVLLLENHSKFARLPASSKRIFFFSFLFFFKNLIFEFEGKTKHWPLEKQWVAWGWRTGRFQHVPGDDIRPLLLTFKLGSIQTTSKQTGKPEKESTAFLQTFVPYQQVRGALACHLFRPDLNKIPCNQ